MTKTIQPAWMLVSAMGVIDSVGVGDSWNNEESIRLISEGYSLVWVDLEFARVRFGAKVSINVEDA